MVGIDELADIIAGRSSLTKGDIRNFLPGVEFKDAVVGKLTYEK